MPGKGAGLAEGLRGLLIVLMLGVVLPGHGLQGVDGIVAGQKIQVTPAQGLGQVQVFGFGIHKDDGLAGLPQIGDNALEQIGFPLPGIAQDEDIGVGLVISPAVKVRENIGAELIPAQVEPMGVGLAGIVEGVEIRHR